MLVIYTFKNEFGYLPFYELMFAITCREHFHVLFGHTKYKETVKIAAESPQGILSSLHSWQILGSW